MDNVNGNIKRIIKPTRSSVVDNRFVNIISGGVNYFPALPYEGNVEAIDEILAQYDDSSDFVTVAYNDILEIMSHLGSVDITDWSGEKYTNCVAALSTKRPKTTCKLIIRKDRDISKGTGTLSSYLQMIDD